jgi:hypothetical protein
LLRRWISHDKARAFLVLAVVIAIAVLLKISQDQHRRIRLASSDIKHLASASIRSAVVQIDLVLNEPSLEHASAASSDLATAFGMVSILPTLDADRSFEWVQIMETIGYAQRTITALDHTDLREQSNLVLNIRDTLQIINGVFPQGPDSRVDEDVFKRALSAGLELRGVQELP